MKYLIVGLGNPGPEYHLTRHNIGFQTVEALAHSHKASFAPARLTEKAEISYKGRKITLIKPTTYMNLSGRAVRYWLQHLQIPATQLLVITDDLHLPFGTIRLRGKGGDAGHNGIKNITQELATSKYPRLRIGIGRDFLPGQQSDYVLGTFSAQEQTGLPPLIQQASDTALSFCWRGITHTMGLFNK